MQWCSRPIIYEIHTRAWLADLTARYHEPITLGTVPAQEWDALAALHIDAVWFMGVWERSPKGIEVSNRNPALDAEFRRALPDYTPADNVGSAYCVRSYRADRAIGGKDGLARARQELAQRSIRLILDFVPNHTAADAPLVLEHPEYFIRGTAEDLARAPNEFVESNGQVFANGRDPFFPPWQDVVQVNAFSPEFRAASIEIVKAISAQCDGMRCDMAMLMLNDIFAKTWGERAGARPETEYWREVIPAVKAEFPDVLFIAEAYWGLELDLMQKGFDYCYDKLLYDRLVHDNASSVRGHLDAEIEYQDKLVRFIENHDEARAAATFASLPERAAAVIVLTVPGAKLLYEGQFEGRKIKTPVFFARRAPETKNYVLDSFYRTLLKEIDAPLFHDGAWTMCECTGWSDNASYQNILAWTWRQGDARALVVVNYSEHRAQAMVHMTWSDLRERVWRLSDSLNGDVFIRDGNQMADTGLFVDLDAWRFHFLRFE